jgi:hypothetical protein
MNRWRTAALGVVLCLFALSSFAQNPINPLQVGSLDGGIAYAPNFGGWKINMGSATTAGGSQTFLASQGYASTYDGVVFVPFVVGERINLGSGSTFEVVTLTAVSNCNALAAPGLPPVCSLTATVANAHSIGEPITSADNGIMEAVGFQSANGGGQVYFTVDCGQITLNTGGLTTTSTCFVPAMFYNQGSASRVTTTITVTASWAVGITGATSAFSTANSTLTVGTTAIANQGTPVAVGTTTGLTALLITGATSNPGAGVVHTKVWGYTSAQPSF